MRTFRVSKPLRQYVNGVLKRKNIPYQYIEKSLETGSFYITKEESENPAAFTELMQVSGRTSFLVL